jgi:hypothetical protein
VTACRSCSEPIFWIVSAAPGHKSMPLNNEPDPTGNVVIENGYARVLNADQRAAAVLDGTTLYRSHFASCPAAQKHRKPKP